MADVVEEKDETKKEKEEDEKEDVSQEQVRVRIAGAVALVAAEFNVSVQQVSNLILVEEGYKFAVENNVDLFEALKTGYVRAVVINQLVDKLHKIVGVDFEPLFHFTDWYKIYDDAAAKGVDPLTAMKEHFTANAKLTEPKPRLDPKRAFRNFAAEERKKLFKPGGAKQTRRDVQKSKQDKAREEAVRKAREIEAKVDKEAAAQLSDNDGGDDDGDVSIGDMY